MTNPGLSAHAWGLIFCLSIIWGSSFLFARIAVLEIPPLSLVFARVALAAFVLNLFLTLGQNRIAPKRNMWRDFAIMGLLNNIVPFGLIFYGQLEIGAGLAAIVNAMTPIWTILFANICTSDEKLTGNRITGMALAFSGVAILIGSSALAGLERSTLGQVAVLGATISYGLAGVFGRRFADVPPIHSARGQLTMSSVMVLPLVLVLDQPWQLNLPSTAAIWSVVALAIMCTALAYLLFFEILARAGAVNVSLVTFLVPPSAIVLGIIVLGESLELRHFLGMAMIMTGLIVIDGRLLRR